MAVRNLNQEHPNKFHLVLRNIYTLHAVHIVHLIILNYIRFGALYVSFF